MTRAWPGEIPPWEQAAAQAELEAAKASRAPVWLLGFVFLATLAAWWPYPGTAYWKSDDFLAVHYASDFGRAVGDFVHNQYDLQGVVWFYRPLITLSFAIDGLVAGDAPIVSHASNALAHALSALLVVLCALRFAGPRAAAICGLVWSLSPAHAGSVLWGAGRVDSHTTVWILLSVVTLLRHLEGKRGMLIASLGAFVVALCSKETALVVPGVATVLGFALPPPERGRLASALRTAIPFALILAVYFGFRISMFGRLGGYEGAFELGPALTGFGISTLRLLNPLEYAGDAVYELPPHVWLAGYAPIALALLAALARRRFRLLATLTLLYLGACVPIAQLLAHSDNLVNLRNFYLPGIALAGLLIAGGWLPGLLALAVFALPLLELRQDYAAASNEVERRHARVIDMTRDTPDGPVFVTGLPPQNVQGTVLMMHVGVDRLARPPFCEHTASIYALRPLAQSRNAYYLEDGDENGVPLGTTLGFSSSRILARLPNRRAAELDIDVVGSLELTSRRIHELIQARQRNEPAKSPAITFPGHNAGDVYRLTLFTGMGYISTLTADDDGRIDAVFELIAFQFDPSNTAQRWGQALRGPTAFDLSTRFPILIESGRLVETPAGQRFQPTAIARDFVWLELDRHFADLIDGREPPKEPR